MNSINDMNLDTALELGIIDEQSKEMLEKAILEKKSIVVVGSAGTGKTMILKGLANVITDHGMSVDIVTPIGPSEIISDNEKGRVHILDVNDDTSAITIIGEIDDAKPEYVMLDETIHLINSNLNVFMDAFVKDRSFMFSLQMPRVPVQGVIGMVNINKNLEKVKSLLARANLFVKLNPRNENPRVEILEPFIENDVLSFRSLHESTSKTCDTCAQAEGEECGIDGHEIYSDSTCGSWEPGD